MLIRLNRSITAAALSLKSNLTLSYSTRLVYHDGYKDIFLNLLGVFLTFNRTRPLRKQGGPTPFGRPHTPYYVPDLYKQTY